MPRQCSSCNKMASLESVAELEDGPDVSADGSVTATVRVVRTSACCGDEMKEMRFELEGAIETDDSVLTCVDDAEHEWEEDGSGEPDVTEGTQTVDRKGKPIKKMRYQATLIGCELEVNAKCAVCGAAGTVTLRDEAKAGEFEEI